MSQPAHGIVQPDTHTHTLASRCTLTYPCCVQNTAADKQHRPKNPKGSRRLIVTGLAGAQGSSASPWPTAARRCEPQRGKEAMSDDRDVFGKKRKNNNNKKTVPVLAGKQREGTTPKGVSLQRRVSPPGPHRNRGHCQAAALCCRGGPGWSELAFQSNLMVLSRMITVAFSGQTHVLGRRKSMFWAWCRSTSIF